MRLLFHKSSAFFRASFCNSFCDWSSPKFKAGHLTDKGGVSSWRRSPKEDVRKFLRKIWLTDIFFLSSCCGFLSYCFVTVHVLFYIFNSHLFFFFNNWSVCFNLETTWMLSDCEIQPKWPITSVLLKWYEVIFGGRGCVLRTLFRTTFYTVEFPLALFGSMKPKLGFSIESLVGGQSSPSLTELSRDGASDSPATAADDSAGRPPSPLSLGPLFPRALLSLQQEKAPPIQRPQPINGATHRVSADASSLPGVLQAAKGLGAFGANPLIPQPLGLASFPQLQGIPLPPQLSPLMMGGGVPGLSPSFPREYPLYPWLLSRHGRIFPQGLPSKWVLLHWKMMRYSHLERK